MLDCNLTFYALYLGNNIFTSVLFEIYWYCIVSYYINTFKKNIEYCIEFNFEALPTPTF